MTISRRAVLKAFATTAAGAVVGAGSYGYSYERHQLEVARVIVPVSACPPSLAGLRIGFLTDVHRSRWGSPEDVVARVDRLMDERPDLIVLGGDYVTWGDRRFVEPSAEALAPLSAPHGVFGILGNHDDDTTCRRRSRRGIEVLKDARTRLTIKGETLELVGHSLLDETAADIAAVLQALPAPSCCSRTIRDD